MATEQASKYGWTIVHNIDDGGYTLECKDSNFDAQTKTICMNTKNKTMDGNVVVSVKAKSGNAPVITSLSDSNANVTLDGTLIVLTKTLVNEGSTFSSGWINSKPTGSVTITLTGVVPTEEMTVNASDTYQSYPHSSGKLISSFRVNGTSIYDWTFAIKEVITHQNADDNNPTDQVTISDATHIFICLTDDCTINDNYSIGGGAIIYCNVSKQNSTFYYEWILKNYDGSTYQLQKYTSQSITFTYKKSGKAQYYSIISIGDNKFWKEV